MSHYPPSFTVILSVMIPYYVWISVMAGATCINTKEPTVCNSSQLSVQCLHISHLILVLVGVFTQWKWANYKSALPALSRLLTINQYTRTTIENRNRGNSNKRMNWQVRETFRGHHFTGAQELVNVASTLHMWLFNCFLPPQGSKILLHPSNHIRSNLQSSNL